MQLLVVTTKRDLSIDDLIEAAGRAEFSVDRLNYDDAPSHIRRTIDGNQYDVVYLRDPFNQPDYDFDRIATVIDQVTLAAPDARYVDDARSIGDLMIEDKWQQYQLLAEFMPETWLLDDYATFDNDAHIAKERLSSRARGIVFARDDLIDGRDYVVQPLFELTDEYRVFGVNDRILPLAAVRTSKTATSKIKMKGAMQLPDDIAEFADRVYRQIPQMNLVGFDIAKTATGDIVLIEINRSPQFCRYNQLTGTNIADELMKGLV